MEIFLFVVIGCLCASQAAKVYSSEGQNKVFNRKELPLTDVKAYNRFCGKLMIAFTLAIELTLGLVILTDGWLSTILSLLMIVEAVALVKYYNKNESKFLRKDRFS